MVSSQKALVLAWLNAVVEATKNFLERTKFGNLQKYINEISHIFTLVSVTATPVGLPICVCTCACACACTCACACACASYLLSSSTEAVVLGTMLASPTP